LPAWKRLGVAGTAAAVLAAAAMYVLFTPQRPSPQAAVRTAHTPNEFRPTDAQWASLTIEPVAPHAFHAQHVTDGKIAINEDRATPVFSPFTGRVSRLIAAPGAGVERGSPLFTIEATEAVQALNDLIAAGGQVNKLRAQVSLAQI